MDIALLVHTTNEWSRKVLMGVAQFGDDNGGWNFVVPPTDKKGEIGFPKGWSGDGIICRPTSSQLEETIAKTELPCVNVSWLGRHKATMPKVVSCESSCAELAIDFLLEKQFGHFGFVGFEPGLNYSSVVETTISERLDHEGKLFDVFPFPKQNTGGNRLRAITSWLQSVEKPIAIVAWTSAHGQLITRACQSCDLRVPDEVAILCIEHDHLFSMLAPVPLTNLDQDPWRVGYSAAKVLQEIIQGAAPPAEEVRIPPLSVVPRMSTDVTAVSDKELGKALQYIYEHAKNGISVSDVVKHVSISRRALENKFKRQLHCSPGTHIRRTQLQLVARLLRTTKLTNVQIAIRAGFEHPEVMMRAFKKEYKLTPAGFRNAGISPRIKDPRSE